MLISAICFTMCNAPSQSELYFASEARTRLRLSGVQGPTAFLTPPPSSKTKNIAKSFFFLEFSIFFSFYKNAHEI